MCRHFAAALDNFGKARLSYLLGKAQDSQGAFAPESESHLEKAVKLDPSNHDAWTCLAHAKFKKRDYTAAKSCVDRALERKSTDIKSLQLASMLLRQLSGPGVDVVANIKESAKLASAAITQNVKDALSWSLLGNAHLSLFFQTEHNPSDLNNARKAHARAAALELSNATVAASAVSSSSRDDLPSDPSTLQKRFPDIHYNKGVVSMFLEEYDEAVSSLELVDGLDPSLNVSVSA
jgi:tetratricopeptide (TPR) repeat protein